MNPAIFSKARFLYKNLRLYSLRHQDLLNIVLRGSKQDISVTGQHSRENVSSNVINNDFYCNDEGKALGELKSRTLKPNYDLLTLLKTQSTSLHKLLEENQEKIDYCYLL